MVIREAQRLFYEGSVEMCMDKHQVENGDERKNRQVLFSKVDGSLREAYGTLKESLLPPTNGSGRKANDTLQTYFDTERQEYRCFKKANLIKMA